MKKRKDKINKLYAQQQKLGIKKYQASENKTVVVMPSPQVKKDLTDYAYGKDIDERVVKMAMQMAEKLAVSMVRELATVNVGNMVEQVIEGVTSQIEAKLPEQQTIIREVVQESTADIKRKAQDEFSFDGPDIAVDRSKGLKLKGEIGTKTKKKQSLNEQLDALDNLDL
jgi:hypothetical protein